MLRRVFSAASVMTNTTSSSSSNNNTQQQQQLPASATTTHANTIASSHGGSVSNNHIALPRLTPRPDVDVEEQKRMVAQEKAASRAKNLKEDRLFSLYGSLAPQEEARVMEFNRHSLRLLVLEAHNRQVIQTTRSRSSSNNSSFNDNIHVDPTSSSSCTSVGGAIPRRGAVTPPPETHFDLTSTHNFNALLQDIDTLMAVAQAKPPQTRDRILNQTYEQVARLSLWNDLA